MIDNLTIERILNTAKIEEVVGDFVQLRKRGVNYVGLCPFHDEKTPSFSVSPSKGICKCFSCGKGGNVAHFIMEHEQVSFYDAIRYLAKRYNIEIQERELTNRERMEQDEREALFIVNSFAKDYFQNTLLNTQEGRNIGLSYFYERGFREDIVQRFSLGYCPAKGGKFTQEALQKGFKKEFLVELGLSNFAGEQYFDRFNERVIFPIHSISGKVVAFGGRILKYNPKVGKYINSPESRIYHKSDELYGMYFAKRAIIKEDRCYLVEGYTDVLSMVQAGIENVVSSGGTSLTKGQIRLIHRFTENICVLYDGDSAGIKASIRGIDMLLGEGINVQVILLPSGDDPDSFAKNHSAEEVLRFMSGNEVDFIRFKANLLNKEAQRDPIKKATLIKDLVNSISLIPDEIKRSVYAKECSNILNADEKMLLNEIRKTILLQRDRDYSKRVSEEMYGNVPRELTPPPLDLEKEPLPYIPPKERSSNPAIEGGMGRNRVEENPLKSVCTNVFYPYERELMKLIVRYGEHLVDISLEDGEMGKINVVQYIDRELLVDELKFSHPLYERMFQEALQKSGEEDFVAQSYFTLHMDKEISMESINLITEKHQLSTIHSKYRHVPTEEEKLPQLLIYNLNLFKEMYVREEEKKIVERMRTLSQEGEASECEELMVELKSLEEIKKILGEKLGGRTLDKNP